MTNNPRSQRRLLGAAILAGLALAFEGNVAEAKVPSKPNIIYIMADDMGYADLSCYGAQGYKTPVLDQLAAEGVKFTQAYTNSPICSPTRTALVTGRYQYRFAAGLNEPNGFKPGQELPLGTPTVASLLKDNGYRTAFVGKWHVAKVPEFSPLRYGYDSFFGIASGAADYFLHKSAREIDDPTAGLRDGDKLVERKGYLTDILADEAIKQIRAGGDKPLFLSLHFNSPHWPWEGPEDSGRAQTLKDSRDPSGGSLETYAKMMLSMDANIGRVLAALDAQGISQDSIIVFTSDNGGERYSNTWPFTGYKGELLEGGIRVPLIVRWPGRIKPGSQSEQVMISMDTVPSFVTAAGGTAPANMDGMNLLPQITGVAAPVARTLFWRFKANNQAAVREGDWKYLKLGGKEHLFNVRKDPRERAELKDVHPEIFAALKAKWGEWNAGMLPYPEGSSSETTHNFYADRFNNTNAIRGAGADNVAKP